MELYFFEHSEKNFTTYKEHMKIIDALEKKDLIMAKKSLAYNWTSTLKTIKSLAKKIHFDDLESLI